MRDLRDDFKLYATIVSNATIESYINDHNDSGEEELSNEEIVLLRSI